VELLWEHDLVLSGTSGQARMTLDSAGIAGPSPMQALGFALAACMAMDVVHVLRKGRHDLRGLTVGLVAGRAEEEPRRFTSAALQFTVTGNVPHAPIQRAIDLSRDKYCSVWNSLREDIELTVSFTVVPGPPG
jgi:putative redox protein